MHPNAALITSFYSAFTAGDHETMAACYADDAVFSDPVFPRLEADEVRAMWRMFCTGSNEIQLTYSDITADDERGSARWNAIYAFPKTERQVHNEISARFAFRDGLVVRHIDDFDFPTWARMALGPVGLVFGRTTWMRDKVRTQADAQLRRFRAGDASPDSTNTA